MRQIYCANRGLERSFTLVEGRKSDIYTHVEKHCLYLEFSFESCLVCHFKRSGLQMATLDKTNLKQQTANYQIHHQARQ